MQENQTQKAIARERAAKRASQSYSCHSSFLIVTKASIRRTEGLKPLREPTKESEHDADKWQPRDLPVGADDDAMTKMVIPLAKIKAGTLGPWENLLTGQVQEIIDKVYGSGCFEVEDEDVWCGWYVPKGALPHNFQLYYRLGITFKTGNIGLQLWQSTRLTDT